MGAATSVNTVVNDVHQTFEQNFSNKGLAKSEANCIHKIKQITVDKLENCNLKFSNNCYANASSVVISSSDLIVNYWQSMSQDQKAAAAMPLTATLNMNTDVNNISTELKQTVENYCKSEAATNNENVMEVIHIGTCTAPPGQPANITFENIGHADANCAMNIVN